MPEKPFRVADVLEHIGRKDYVKLTINSGDVADVQSVGVVLQIVGINRRHVLAMKLDHRASVGNVP